MMWIRTLVILGMLFFFFAYRKYFRMRRHQVEELGRLSSERLDTELKYDSLKHELEVLETDKDIVIKEKKEEIAHLTELLEDYKTKYDKLSNVKRETAIKNNRIVKRFREKLRLKRGTRLPEASDWNLLTSLFQKNLPSFYEKVILDQCLTRQEAQTCMLCRLDFHSGEIAVLLDTAVQRVTNAKISSNTKLFGDKRASTLKNNLREV